MIREKQIEDNFINKLVGLKYVYRSDICDRYTLEQNFRGKFERLNRVNLSDSEFNRLLEEITDSDVFASSKRLREINTFIREDGTPLQYTLVNIRDWCKNEYEVINQLRINTKNSFQRYDVILLVNGLPVVQVELKTLDVSPRRAMQQIVCYKNDPGNGYANSLLCFMQLFIVSNYSNTYYFANNNPQHFNFNAEEQFLPVYQWARDDNKKISCLDSFAEQFLPKCHLGEIISRYMVLISGERKLLIMRPYQIYAVKAIVRCIEENRGNGYIWHTTGSGKTLTSFKASTLLKDNPDIEKCLFVVDRKDLDRQTRQEFNRFQENCVEENTDTETLVRRLLSTDYADKVIVTTIQKLGIALDSKNKKKYKEQLLPLKESRIVFIFDECHRSQFGENHKAIKEFFPHAQLFGFTGTPIFDENASYTKVDGETATYKTTEDVFEKQLHAYTITNAINDKNVLRFHVDYFKPDANYPSMSDGSIRKQSIVETILSKHDAVTDHRRFNAILATSSIDDAIEYYRLFKRVQEQRRLTDDSFEQMNVACVFSPPADGNSDIKQIQEDLRQERIDNEYEPEKKKQALKEIIEDYNRQYGTNHSIADFDSYYQDIQQRIKDQQYSNKDYPHVNKIDITIVVDMLLTGFDSKYLNTLYVDKRLAYHGLIQAFSRTNRILNETKPFGNVLDFRGQQDAVDEAIALFSGEDRDVARRIWLVEPASLIQKKYKEAVAELRDFMQSYDLPFEASEVVNLKGDDAKVGFIKKFKEVQRYKTQLSQYVDLTEKTDASAVSDTQSGYGFTDDDLLAFRGAYLDLTYGLKKKRDKSSASVSPEVDNIDFEFVLFASALIDYDYIMDLIARHYGGGVKVRMTREQLINMVMSNSNLMEEREIIVAYINSLELDKVKGKTEQEIKDGYVIFKAEQETKDIDRIAKKYEITSESLTDFVNSIMERKIFDAEKLNDLLAPLNLGWKVRSRMELSLMSDLIPLLELKAGQEEISGLQAYKG